MQSFQNIFVPTDFSEPATRAVEVAIGMAITYHANLTLLHAAWAPPVVYAGYLEGSYWPADDSDASKKALAEALATAREKYPSTKAMLVVGENWRAILKAVKDQNADLIVMGTHGRSGISRIFLGSVAERVVRFSPIPVLTVSGKDEQAARAKSVAELTLDNS
jgi:nucleotide-binding universal stress UspA family protein